MTDSYRGMVDLTSSSRAKKLSTISTKLFPDYPLTIKELQVIQKLSTTPSTFLLESGAFRPLKYHRYFLIIFLISSTDCQFSRWLSTLSTFISVRSIPFLYLTFPPFYPHSPPHFKLFFCAPICYDNKVKRSSFSQDRPGRSPRSFPENRVFTALRETGSPRKKNAVRERPASPFPQDKRPDSQRMSPAP